MTSTEDFFHFHRQNIHYIIEGLVQQNKDVRQLNDEVPVLQIQLLSEMEKLKTNVINLPRSFVATTTYTNFSHQIDNIHCLADYFKTKLRDVKKSLEYIFTCAQISVNELMLQKYKFKNAYEETVKGFQESISNGTDEDYIRNIESRLFVLHSSYLLEARYVNENENSLKPLFIELYLRGVPIIDENGVLKHFNWIPKFEGNSQEETVNYMESNIVSIVSHEEIVVQIQQQSDDIEPIAEVTEDFEQTPAAFEDVEITTECSEDTETTTESSEDSVLTSDATESAEDTELTSEESQQDNDSNHSC